MPFVYTCPVDDCEFMMEDSELEFVVENVEQHQRDVHDADPDRGELEESISGSGQP